MRKIDLILENIRDEYMINLLEEGEVTELQTLKTKKFLNESLQAIRGMLVEEGTMDNVKDHLKNNWGKYLAGAGAAGLAGAGYGYRNELGDLANIAAGEGSVGDKINFAKDYLNSDNFNPADATMDQSNLKDAIPYMPSEAGLPDELRSQMTGEDLPNEQARAYAAENTPRAANPALQNAQSIATQADQEAIINPIANSEYSNAQLAGMGAAGAAALGGAGYGAKKLVDRYRK